MENSIVQVPAPIENNMINKEENTMKKFSVSIIIDNVAYTKEYDKSTAFGIYKIMVWHDEIAIITDDNGFFLSHFAELPEYKRVYGATANTYLKGYEEMALSAKAKARLEAEEAELIEMSRRQHRAAQRVLENRRGICAMRRYRPFFREFGRPIGHRPTDCDVPEGSKTKITDSFLDMCTDFVEKIMPDCYGGFNVNVLLNDPLCEVIPGLLGTSHYSWSTGKFEDEGLFASIAFRHLRNSENIKDSDNKEDDVKVLASVRYAEAYLELEKFATQNGRTMIEICDNLTRWLFGTRRIQNNVKMEKALYDLYFGVFGDMVARIAEFDWRCSY